MTQENKDLLLKDLCARLPYGVKVVVKSITPEATIGSIVKKEYIYNGIGELNAVYSDDDGVVIINLNPITQYRVDYGRFNLDKDSVIPYLFPLSSMTEEQKQEYDSIIYHNIELHCERYYNVIDVDNYEELHDFYHRNHLDYRNMIGKGLAIDATGLNIY